MIDIEVKGVGIVQFPDDMSQEQIQSALDEQFKGKAKAEPEPERETSAAGAFLREAAMGALPSLAAGGATVPGAAVGRMAGAKLGAKLGGRLPGIAGGVGTFVGAAAGALGASALTSTLQKAALQAGLPEFLKDVEAGEQQHPLAAGAGRVASAITGFTFAPGESIKGIAAIPALLRGTATQSQKLASLATAGQIGLQGGLTAAQTEYGQGRLPTKLELAEAATTALLFGRSRFHKVPTSPTGGVPNASQDPQAAAIHGNVPAQPGQGPGQVPVQGGRPEVQPQAAPVAKEAQVPLNVPEVGEAATLTGSEKQIKWAEAIRRKAISRFNDPYEKAALSSVSDAAWWIDNKDNLMAGKFMEPTEKALGMDKPAAATAPVDVGQLEPIKGKSEAQIKFGEAVRQRAMKQAWTSEQRAKLAEITDASWWIGNKDALAKGEFPGDTIPIPKKKDQGVIDLLESIGWDREAINRLTEEQALGILRQRFGNKVNEALAGDQAELPQQPEGVEHAPLPKSEPAETKPTGAQAEFEGMPESSPRAKEAHEAAAKAGMKILSQAEMEGKELGGEQPFARMGNSTIFMSIGGNRIAPNWKVFNRWIHSDVPKGKESEAIRAAIDEERWHGKVIDLLGGISKAKPKMEEYWDLLTWAEKKINNRRYGGTWKQVVSNSDMGHEAIRFRLQRAARMTPLEFAQTAGVEHWSMKSLTVLEDLIRGLRKGTKASGRQEAIFNHIQGNITAAKAAIQEGQEGPQARVRGKPSDEVEAYAKAVMTDDSSGGSNRAVDIGMKVRTIDDLERLAELRREMMKAPGLHKGMSPEEMNTTFRKQMLAQYPREAIETAVNAGSNDQQLLTGLGLEPGERPMDWHKNPEVRDWLVENAESLGIKLPEELMAQAGPQARSRGVDSEGRTFEQWSDQYGKLVSIYRNTVRKLFEAGFTSEHVEALIKGGPESVREILPKGSWGLGHSLQILNREVDSITDSKWYPFYEELSNNAGGEGRPNIGPGTGPQARTRRHKGLEPEQGRLPGMEAPPPMARFKDPGFVEPPVEQRGGSEAMYGYPAIGKLMDDYLAKVITKTKEKEVPELEGVEPGPHGFNKGAPTFRKFVEYMERNELKSEPETLHNLWVARVGKMLSEVSGDRLSELLSAAGLTKKTGVGSGKIADPMPAEAKEKLPLSMAAGLAEVGPPWPGKKRLERAAMIRKRADELELKAKSAKSEEEGYKPPRFPGVERTILASKEQLLKQAKGMRTQAELVESKAEISTVPPAKDPMGKDRTFRTQQARRRAAMGELFNHFIEQTMPSEANLSRTAIDVEDIAWNHPSAADQAWINIPFKEVDDPLQLARDMGKEARTKGLTPSITKRLMVLRNKKTGDLVLVSAFAQGKDQPLRVPDLTGGTGIKDRPYTDLNAERLKDWRPVYGILLSEPIRKFYKRFGEMTLANGKKISPEAQFNKYLGAEAKERAASFTYEMPATDIPTQKQRGYKQVLPEETRPGETYLQQAMEGREITVSPEQVAADVEGSPGLEGQGGLFIGEHAGTPRAQAGLREGELAKAAHIPLTAVEARDVYDILSEHGIDTPLTAPQILDILKQSHESGGLSNTERTALSGIYKVANRISRAYEREMGQPMDQLTAAGMAVRDLAKHLEDSNSMGDYLARVMMDYGPIPEKPPTPSQLAARGAFLRAEAKIQPSPTALEMFSRPGGARTKAPTFTPGTPKDMPGVPMPEAFASEAEKSRYERALAAREPLNVPKGPHQDWLGEREPRNPMNPTVRMGEPSPMAPQILDAAAANHVEDMAIESHPTERKGEGGHKVWDVRKDWTPEGEPTEHPGLKERGIRLTGLISWDRKVQKWLEHRKGLSPSEYRLDFDALQDAPKAIVRKTLKRAYNAGIGEMLSFYGQAKFSRNRRGAQAEIVRLRDAADTIATTLSRMIHNTIGVESATKKFPTGKPEVLSAAMARMSVNRINPNTGNNYTYDEFRAMLNQGEFSARNMIASRAPGLEGFEIRREGRKAMDDIAEMRKDIDYAEANHSDPELLATVDAFKREMDLQYAIEIAHGGKMGYDSTYIPGVYEGEFFDDHAITFGERTLLGRQYRKPAVFDNYYEAMSQGYRPATRNMAQIAESRSRAGLNKVSQQQWWTKTKNIIDPASGRAIAKDPVKIRDQWVVPPGEADRVLVSMIPGGKPLAVLKGYQRVYNQMIGRSGVSDWQLGRAALTLTGIFKHGFILMADTFHLGRLFEYGAALTGRKMARDKFKSYNPGFSALEYRPQDLQKAVNRGAISQSAADFALKPERVILPSGQTAVMTRQEIGQMLQTRGLNVGRIQDALYKHFVDSWPVLGRFNRWLFDRVTRGIMHETGVNEFLRLNKEAGSEMSPTELATRVARDTNIFFGSMGRQGLMRSATARDLAQMFFLAPQWVEGLIRKEASFYSRIPKSAILLASGRGREANVEFGTVGRGMARGLLMSFALTQAINLITRRQPTWMNEDDHKTEAWIPDATGESPGFWFNFNSVFSEMTHDLLRLHETKDNIWSEIRQIGENKLGIPGRVAVVLKEQKTPLGQDITTTAGVFREAGKAAIPIPISLGKPIRQVAHAMMPDTVAPNIPGAMQRQLVASAGVKIDPARDPVRLMQRRADRFEKESGMGKVTGWKQVQTDEASYSKLRSAVRMGDNAGAKKLLEELRKGRTDNDILKAMKANAQRPFTGNHRLERMFLYDLTDEERELYSRAMIQKQEDLMKFFEWFISNA